MSKLKSIVISGLAAAGTLIASTAFAAHYTVGGNTNGTTNFTGPTNATVLGNSLPCDQANFAMQVTNGVARVTAATFGPTSACQAITANNLPWSVAAPTSSAGPNNVTINGISVTIPALGVTCTGNVTGTLNNSGVFSFSGNLGACTVQSRSPHLSSSPTADAVFP
ncbi:hypothetical protein [Luteimonas suaedae]|uniref:hypothetical protein n=1 Tax=Luteimonas suaedae TaxID=2605430 RepID=UPI0011EEE914|nr:hypothetical protein [Luteimonas suaedae]